MEPISFVTDAHLGRLAKWLRLLGFDTLYSNNGTTTTLIQLAKEDNRVLLSRNVAYAKLHDVSFLKIHSEDSMLQLKQILAAFDLSKHRRPFTRCLLCNGVLEDVAKKGITSLLEENTKQYFDEFWRCSNCGHIYWKGSHYKRIAKLLKELGMEKE